MTRHPVSYTHLNMIPAMLGIGSSLFFLLAPETGISLLSSLAPRFLQLSPATLQLPALLCGLCGILFLIAGIMLINRSRHFKKQLDTETRLLQEMCIRDSYTSDRVMRWYSVF